PSAAGELIAEFLGTLVLVALGDGVVAMVVLFAKDVPGGVFMGGYTNITIGWGLAVLMGICVAGRVSGGHLNPAVTLAMAAFRDFPWAKVAPYMAAQTAGGFAGAALVYVNYLPKFHEFDPDLSKTASVFATVPGYEGTWAFGLLDQVVGTALLIGLILAITEPRNPFMHPTLHPLLIGLVVVAIGVSWGGMHGYAINPARDLGPRLFTLVAGFQNTGFVNGVFLVPIAGPLLGGLLGAAVYDRAIRPYVPTAPAV
ncbi:MAG: MIP/aquaporin family protein, partial [Gemmataceae bacterium]